MDLFILNLLAQKVNRMDSLPVKQSYWVGGVLLYSSGKHNVFFYCGSNFIIFLSHNIKLETPRENNLSTANRNNLVFFTVTKSFFDHLQHIAIFRRLDNP